MTGTIESLEFKVPGKPIESTSYALSLEKFLVSYAGQGSDILVKVREICGWKRPTFPGSQPVSLSSANIGELGRVPYVACEKSDGVRYLLFAASGLVFLIDRKETVQVLEMALPIVQPALDDSATPPLSLKRHQVTLLDGELVHDQFKDGTKQVSFLVYDSVCINRNMKIAKMNLIERLRIALIEVIRPRVKYEANFSTAVEVEHMTNNYMPIYLKDFFEIWDILAIKNFSERRLPHISDGIIFTPVALPYVPGTCRGLMKWKPPELNTVDFAAELMYGYNIDGQKWPVGARLMIGRRGFQAYSGYWMTGGDSNAWKAMIEREVTMLDCDGAIWECNFDAKKVMTIPRSSENDLEKDKLREVVSAWQNMCRVLKSNPVAKAEVLAYKKSKNTSYDRKDLLEALTKSHDYGRVLKIVYALTCNLSGFPPDTCPIVTDKSGSSFYDFTSVIFEEEGSWQLERMRTDKLTPNDERVMQRVKDSIESGIDFAHLFEKLLSYRAAGLKPVHSQCAMPEYFEKHGSRTQTQPLEPPQIPVKEIPQLESYQQLESSQQPNPDQQVQTQQQVEEKNILEEARPVPIDFVSLLPKSQDDSSDDDSSRSSSSSSRKISSSGSSYDA